MSETRSFVTAASSSSLDPVSVSDPRPSPEASAPSSSIDSLAGRVALVTGAGRGLGQVMASHLAAAGMRVALVARSAAELKMVADAIHVSGSVTLPLVADVTDPDVVERAVAETEARLGPIDLLVNNAGLGAVPGPLWEADPARWWRTFEVNLFGVFVCTRAVLRRMVPRGAGRIVNVSSRAGNLAVPYASSYSTSKAALTRLTEIAAAEAAPHGIHVFALEPGTVRTAMTEELLEGDAGRTWLPGYRTTFDEGRDAPPEDAARLVVRLARGDADALSGRFISRADDLDALVAQADELVREDRLVLRLAR
jgi:NAD(P)-dependent dehydrogenase (short-subunit alcohol dehydrogenase family)